MDLIEAILVALIQGATELFPVSSLGHAVILPALLHLSLDEKAPEFLPFLVLLHLGTAAALLLYFWHDWWLLLIGALGISSPHQRQESRRVILLIIVATIPAIVVGFLLEKFLRGLFGAPVVAAAFLVLNGLMLAGGERIRTAFADCPFGRLLIGTTDKGVCFLGFAEPDDALMGDLRRLATALGRNFWSPNGN